MTDCKHKFVYKSEAIPMKPYKSEHYMTKRVVIFCESCGKVTKDSVIDEHGRHHEAS